MPVDFLRLLSVRNGPDFSLEADATGSQWILSDASAPLDILYLYDVVDAGRLPPHAVEALARWLAYDLAEDLTQSNTKKQDAAQALGVALTRAKRINGMQKQPEPYPAFSFLQARDQALQFPILTTDG